MNGFLRWAGSKRQLLPRLRQYWSETPGRCYIEPFAGSACLFFELEPQRAILADLNNDLVQTLQALKDDVESVIRAIAKIRRGKSSYYRLRKMDPGAMSPTDRAARFLFLNRYCFNGLYRTNRSGHFNVPYAKPKPQSGGFDFENIRSAASLLARASILSGDFETTIASARSGDFVYMDPPYSSSSRRIFGEYLPGAFSAVDLQRLHSAMCELDRRGVQFLVSYLWSREHREVFENWSVTRVHTRRNIAGFCSDRRGAYEILVTNIPVS